ncbi:MAG: hypothetical protein GF309_07055 [Candidatus Lokiarchaeota archaeon]|nr:hypothetical protein [Candidatus Lokiarchaeota archaeon]
MTITTSQFTKPMKYPLFILGRVLFLSLILLSGIFIPFTQKTQCATIPAHNEADDWDNPDFPLSSHRNVTFEVIVTDGPTGSSIAASAMIYAESEDTSSGPMIGFGISLLRAEIVNAPVAQQIEGLGFGMLRDYAIAYRDSIPVFNEWQNGTPGWKSWRPYAAWTETRGEGWGSLVPPEDWDNLSLIGDVVEIENLTVYLANGQSIRCGPDIIRIAANFTRTPDGWDSTYYVEIEGGQAEVDGTQIHLDLGGAIPPSPLRALPYVGIAAGVVAALVILWHRGKQQ